jgi:hypothetical protein
VTSPPPVSGPDEHDVAQVQVLDQAVQVVGVGVQVVAVPGL